MKILAYHFHMIGTCTYRTEICENDIQMYNLSKCWRMFKTFPILNYRKQVSNWDDLREKNAFPGKI